MLLHALVKKPSMEWRCIDSLVKKKVWAHHSIKKFMLTMFWDTKGLITIDFLEKGATINSVFLLIWQNSPYLLYDPSHKKISMQTSDQNSIYIYQSICIGRM